MKQLIGLFVFLFLLSCNYNVKKQLKDIKVTLTPLNSGVTASFRGAATDGNQTWISGSNGAVLGSTNQGATWQSYKLPDADSLGFRDIAILDKNTVLLMTIGNGTQTRVYKTNDAGKSWRATLINKEEKAFFDGFDFWDAQSGVMISDPIDDKLYVLRTSDAGETWTRIGAEALPPLLNTEYCFAASGTGIIVMENTILIATGGDQARIFRSMDRGKTWAVYPTPIASGNTSSGIFSIAFRDRLNGIAIGGDYLDPEKDKGNVARTTDGGKTWTLVKNDPPMLHKACVQYLGDKAYLAAGRTGVVLSTDDGLTWKTITKDSYYTIAYDQKSRIGFLAGKEGGIARFEIK